MPEHPTHTRPMLLGLGICHDKEIPDGNKIEAKILYLSWCFNGSHQIAAPASLDEAPNSYIIHRQENGLSSPLINQRIPKKISGITHTQGFNVTEKTLCWIRRTTMKSD
jgi:hypothetical protein